MIPLYQTVLIQERNIDRSKFSADNNDALSKHVSMQGIYLTGAYFLTRMFWYVYTVINNFFDTQLEWLWILNVIFILCQGFYNLIVYLRLRYLWFRQEHCAHQGSSALITSFFLYCVSKVTV